MAKPWIRSSVGYGETSNSVKIVQRALIKLGFSIPAGATGYWGGQTKTAYAAWQRSLGYSGSDADGTPGPTSLRALAAKGGFDVRHAPAPPAPSAGTEPAQNMTKTTWNGRVINMRTKVMLQQAQRKFGRNIVLSQGSYSNAVSASAGTHGGGGVVDISVGGLTSTQRAVALVRALREAGFAAWLRTPSEGFSYHVHACAIGDAQMAASARNQVASYFAGRNALASNRADTAPGSVGRPYPAWAAKYK